VKAPDFFDWKNGKDRQAYAAAKTASSSPLFAASKKAQEPLKLS
jgi:hypothetical protein